MLLVLFRIMGHSDAASAVQEYSDGLEALRNLTEEWSTPADENKLIRGRQSGSVGVDSMGKPHRNNGNGSVLRKFTDKEEAGQNPRHASNKQSFIAKLKSEIQSLTSQLEQAEDLPKYTHQATILSHVSEHAKPASQSASGVLLFRGHEGRGKASSMKAMSKSKGTPEHLPMEPGGVLNSNASGADQNNIQDADCTPAGPWWGRRLLQQKGFYMASCENMGWRQITSWCDCKEAAQHIAISEERHYTVNPAGSCDGLEGCKNEPPGCYVSEGIVKFNPPRVWAVSSCSSWTIDPEGISKWSEEPNSGCICMGSPTTTTTSTTLPCTDFSGYYKNKQSQTVAVQQEGCALTVLIQGTTWTQAPTVEEGGWHLYDPPPLPNPLPEGTAAHSSMEFAGTIGRSLTGDANPNGTEVDGTVNPSFPWGKVMINFDNTDVWTRMTCNIFGGQYSDDWEIMQSGCLVNITGAKGALGLDDDEKPIPYLLGKVVGNFMTFPGTKWKRIGKLNQKLYKIIWSTPQGKRAAKSWTRATVEMHSDKTVPPPE